MKDGSGSCTMQPGTHSNKTFMLKRQPDSAHFFVNDISLLIKETCACCLRLSHSVRYLNDIMETLGKSH
jgi:hypothetical protein